MAGADETRAPQAFARIAPREIDAARMNAALEALDVAVAPRVDHSSLQSTLELLQAINAEIARANGGVPTLYAGARSVSIPSMGKRLRGDFSAAGDPVS
jgi:hypothetical protein